MLAGVRASIEAWGDGIYRCAYSFVAQGPSAYTIELLSDDAQAPIFAGDGTTVALLVAAPQVDVGRAFASLPAADPRAGRRPLTFVADDGNLPKATAATLSFRALLPAGPRLTDRPRQPQPGRLITEQIQVFVTRPTGQVKFWGLGGTNTYWSFDPPRSASDGALHGFVASWSAASARLVIDGTPAMEAALVPNGPPTGLDRIGRGLFGNEQRGPRRARGKPPDLGPVTGAARHAFLPPHQTNFRRRPHSGDITAGRAHEDADRDADAARRRTPASAARAPDFAHVYEEHFAFVWRNVLTVAYRAPRSTTSCKRCSSSFTASSRVRGPLVTPAWLAGSRGASVSDFVAKRGNAPAGDAMEGRRLRQRAGRPPRPSTRRSPSGSSTSCSCS